MLALCFFHIATASLGVKRQQLLMKWAFIVMCSIVQLHVSGQ